MSADLCFTFEIETFTLIGRNLIEKDHAIQKMHQEPPSIVGENPDREIGLRQISAEPSSTPAKGPPQACLFVGSISPETTEAQLISHFSQFGTVLKVKLLKDKVNSKPYAFVQYSVCSNLHISKSIVNILIVSLIISNKIFGLNKIL